MEARLKTMVLVGLTLVLGAVAWGCAPGQIDEQFGQTGTLDDTGGALVGEYCAESADCMGDLRCLSFERVQMCVQECTSHQECLSGFCIALPGAPTGFCSMDQNTPGRGDAGSNGGKTPDNGGGSTNPIDDGPIVDDPDPSDDNNGTGSSPSDTGKDPIDDGGSSSNPPADDDDDEPVDPGDGDDDDNGSGSNPGGSSGPCTYPSHNNEILVGAPVFPIRWTNAYDGSGNRVDVDFEELHCNGQYTTILVYVGSPTCGACPPFIQALSQQLSGFEAAGTLVIYTGWGNSSEETRQWINGEIGNAPGLRAGGYDITPDPWPYLASPEISGFPGYFMVRTSDMEVIASRRTHGTNIGTLVQLAQQNQN